MRVLIADDHALFRDGLRSLLEARGVEVIAEAQDGHQAVERFADSGALNRRTQELQRSLLEDGWFISADLTRK